MADTTALARRLEPMLAGAGAPEEIEALLVSNSNLPGPRANLELASAFADCFARSEPTAPAWDMLVRWAEIPEELAPTGGPREFLPFCALQALGALYPGAGPDRRRQIARMLRGAAEDGRWRLREAVAMALQRIGERDFAQMRGILSRWMDGAPSPEVRRAIVAALAHPPILREPANARYCLEVSDRILRDLLPLDRSARRTEGFRVLRQGLEYALSVFAASLPEEGFAFLPSVQIPTRRSSFRRTPAH